MPLTTILGSSTSLKNRALILSSAAAASVVSASTELLMASSRRRFAASIWPNANGVIWKRSGGSWNSAGRSEFLKDKYRSSYRKLVIVDASNYVGCRGDY